MIIVRSRRRKNRKLRKEYKDYVCIERKSDTSHVYVVWNEPVRIDRPRLNLPPDKINLRHFIHTSVLLFFNFILLFFFECGFCPNLLGFSTCLLSFFSIAAVAACHVQCILEFDDFFFSLLHRYPFLQIQYIWTASVTQSIISLHFFVYFCFSLLFFAWTFLLLHLVVFVHSIET